MKKVLALTLALLLCLSVFAACGNAPASSASSAASSSESSAEATPAPTPTAEPTAEPTAAPTEEPTPAPAAQPVRVAALKGPTAMGMVKMMSDDTNSGADKYEFTIAAAIDEITPNLLQGNYDIAAVPANVGSVLYNNTEGKVQVLAVNTLGVLYIAEKGDTVHSAADLKGRTIYSAGKGATPEYALTYMLQKNGLDPETDVTIEWKSEHAECVAALAADENALAMLPQPFLTTAMMKDDAIRVALDLNEEWETAGAGTLITGCVVVRKEYAEAHADQVKAFLEDYAASVSYVNENVEDAAQLIESYDIVPSAVAKKALPACNIVCLTGDELKKDLSSYLQVLFDFNPKSVGGAMPGDDFYYAA